VTMSPKVGGMYMDYSRQLLLQSTPSIDLIVQNDIAKECALGIDKGVFHGSGTTQPTGIYLVDGVGSVAGGGFGWEQAVEFETDVAVANADINTMAFVMGAAARGTLKTRLKALNTAEFLIDRDQRMNGYPVHVTNQIDPGYIFLGDFSQAIVGEWGSLDILVDPYTAGSAGTVRVRGLVAFDVAVRHAAAFSVCDDLT
jgi:HK97 family phage major capsid protein